MATAPRPGAVAEARAAETSARIVYKLTVNGQEWLLRQADLGPADARAVRQATGLRLMQVLSAGADDLDHMAVLWWLARRHNGEPDVPYTTAEAELPGYDAVAARTLRLRIDVDDSAEGDGSPEA